MDFLAQNVLKFIANRHQVIFLFYFYILFN